MKSEIRYEPKIDLLEGMIPPDAWFSSSGFVPPNDFVVSRREDGSIVSRYGDTAWDRTPYQIDGRSTWLYFTNWCEEPPTIRQLELSGEIRFLMFVLIWMRQGAPLANSSLVGYMQMLRKLALFADERNVRIQDVLSAKDLLVDFCNSKPPGAVFTCLHSLLNILLRLGVQRVGFNVLGSDARKSVSEIVVEYRDASKQFSPLPTRIYSSVISLLKNELDDWEKVEGYCLGLVCECIRNPLFGRSEKTQVSVGSNTGISRVPGEYYPIFDDLLVKYGLVEYFNDRGFQSSILGLSRCLTFILTVAKLYIVAYSGMRNKEASNLPYHCIDVETDGVGKAHCIIVGQTTKLKRATTKWVTNQEGHRAIAIAQRIADVIYSKYNIVPSNNPQSRNNYPLFVSPAYLGFIGAPPKGKSDIWQTLIFAPNKKSFKSLRDRFQPLIEEEDIRELEYIDPHRDWRGEEVFAVGRPWQLTDHQLRRSLALYAQRSGLVSLPSLRRQLQHITEEMSRYYARGSVFAKNFIGGDKEHFGLEWQDAGAVSAGLAYIRDILFSNETIFGGHIKWIEHRKNSPDGQVVMDRVTTMRRFKKGELAYRETPIGGCAKVGDCAEVAIRLLDVDCLAGCPNMVGNLTKLERVIAAQTTLVNKLQKDTIEWRMENEDLCALVAARNKVLKERDEICHE